MRKRDIEAVPDGGWGWFVVLSVFVGNILTDGTIGTFGLLYPYIMSEFYSSPAVTSLTGSLIPAVYMMSAPLAGMLIHRFDCRRVSVLGGLIAAFGIVLASFSRNIGEFALTYGVLGGLGIGMNSLCGHLMVNTYFSKKRGIANGIVSSGAGMGVFILTPLLQYLLENYTWRGTMLIYSGCVLQYCVCGMFFRPYLLSKGEKRDDRTASVKDQAMIECDVGSNPSGEPLLKPDTIFVSMDDEVQIPHFFHSQGTELPPKIYKKDSISLSNVHETSTEFIKINSLPDLSLTKKESNLSIYNNSGLNGEKNESFPRYSCNNVLVTKNKANQSLVCHYLSPLTRTDILYSGSICNLKEYKTVTSVEDFLTTVTVDDRAKYVTENQSVDGNHCSPFQRHFSSLCSRFIDISVFRNSVYAPVLLGGIFVQMGQFIPSTFLPNYCYSIGLDNSDVTVILLLYGVMNIVGRLTAGVLANMDSISTLWLCTFGNFICGVACAFFPFCKLLVSLCGFAAVFGCFIGFFGPLQVLIMVEYLRLEKLTAAMGILQLAKGPAALFGPPLAGLVFQWTKNYGTCMLVASCMFIISASCQSTVPIIEKISKRKIKESTYM